MLAVGGSRAAQWCLGAGFVAMVAAASTGAHAQSHGDAASGKPAASLLSGPTAPPTLPPTLPPAAPLNRPAAPPIAPPTPPPTPPLATAPGSSAAADPTSPTALVPPPWSYLSSVWTLWPHAWAYVPSIWKAWYADFPVPASAASQAEPAGGPSVTIVDSNQVSVVPRAIAAPPVGLADPDSQGLPPPRLVKKRRYNLVISGAGLMLATWAADRLLANGLSSSPETWVPLIGPWFLLAQQSSLASPNPNLQAAMIIDGLLQAGGLTMGLLGFVLTTKRYVITVKPRSVEFTPQETP